MAQYTRTATKFVQDPTLIKKLGVNPEMGIMLGQRADLAADATRSIAPVGKTSKAGEHYKDKIDSDVRIVAGRFVGRVNAHKFTSAWLEFGTIRMRPRAPLRRGAEMTGLLLVARRRGSSRSG